jgi:uncharacterized cupin superfamily protein
VERESISLTCAGVRSDVRADARLTDSTAGRPGFDRCRKRVAGEHLGASLYALPPGQATFAYHYELGNDELLVVVVGTPTLRSPEGVRELKPGDCVHFPSGEAGAHQIVNRSGDEARVLLVSSFANMPRAAVQPDSQKLMARWGIEPDEQAWFHLDSATDLWDGEMPPTKT